MLGWLLLTVVAVVAATVGWFVARMRRFDREADVYVEGVLQGRRDGHSGAR